MECTEVWTERQCLDFLIVFLVMERIECSLESIENIAKTMWCTASVVSELEVSEASTFLLMKLH
jgi:hypothetical protein